MKKGKELAIQVLKHLIEEDEKLESLEAQVAELAKNYREEWKEELWESEDIEVFGFNEFIGGKAEGYEDCLEIIKKWRGRGDV
ncbi:MAG: hypothetical protein Q8P62_02470 [Candidatus Peregrinibacteria bacterium]|nr:hypothetical protein [Candidatus Peregrinibacteria bacterium]